VRRARGWIGVLKLDAWTSCAVYSGATVAFYLLGAAILHRQGTVPEDANLHAALSEIYVASFGPGPGLWVYALGAAAVLFSTFFVAIASSSRIFTDALGVFRRAPLAEEPRRRMVRVLTVLLPAGCWVAASVSAKPVTLVFVGALAQAALLPFLGLAALLFRSSRKAEPRPGRIEGAMLWLAFLALAAVGLHQLYDVLWSP